MNVWVLLVASAVALQSLGEIAEREKKRRERNAERGVEAVSFTGTGDSLDPVPSPRSDAPAATVETEPETAASEDGDTSSPLAAERERGKELEPRLEKIALAADVLDGLYQRYLDRCHNRYAVGVTPPGIGIPVGPSNPVNVESGRDWFVVLDTPSATSTTVNRTAPSNILLVQTVECQELWRDIVEDAMAIKQSMRELLAYARQEGILPGVVRDLRRKYQLEWSGWER